MEITPSSVLNTNDEQLGEIQGNAKQMDANLEKRI
jgi:hypothetical protein